METKKAWEFLLLAHPCSQAFALPQLKDKQRSQPTPSGIIYTTHSHIKLIWPSLGYNSPTQTFRYIISVS